MIDALSSLRKRTIAIVGIAAFAATISLFFTFQMYRVVTLENFKLLTVVPVQTYSPEQVKDIQQKVCGRLGQDDWVPEKVNFVYLQPSETILRIPCTFNPAGFDLQDFYIDRKGEPVIINDDNRHLIFSIYSAQQAAEYAVYFGVIADSGIGSSSLILTEEEYMETGHCGQLRSPVKELTVSTFDGNQHYEVELNFFSLYSGSINYAKYQVSRDGALELLREDGLNCGYMT